MAESSSISAIAGKCLVISWLVATPAAAQDASDQNQGNTTGMDMSKSGTTSNAGQMPMHGAFGNYAMNRDSSGTSWQPDLGPAMGQMTMLDDWMLMSRVALLGIYDNQSGPRGG